MAKTGGKYILDKEENFSTYLKSLGVPDNKIDGALKAIEDLEIKVDGDIYTVVTPMGTKVFPINKEIEEHFGDHVAKSTASISGNNIVIVSVEPDGKKGKRIYQPTDDGLIVTASRDDLSGTGKLFYKKS